ncbi:hypothetical protein KIL84_019391 [Mauremys mutica]|uniref:Uncharacterized protein n=1 Tax=Mauremys mutica TaxID=74926 RepID=A0A9D4B3A7_9SAUR|nr:hypothetical protein KIL84_019391 [Mauremys mutica]
MIEKGPTESCKCNVTEVVIKGIVYWGPLFLKKEIIWEPKDGDWSLDLGVPWEQWEELVDIHEKIKQYGKDVSKSAQLGKISILLHNGQILKLGKEGEELTVHHWFNVFKGWCPSATAPS